MTLIIPINTQALRVTPNDASLVTKNAKWFSGATTAYNGLPWREPNPNGPIVHSGTLTEANVATNIYNPLEKNVLEQLNAGIHMHWALPSRLTQGHQDDTGELQYEIAPNRWLVTRIIKWNGQFKTKQWLVESDYLMTPDEYVNEYYPTTKRTSISIPVGWDVPPDYDIESHGGAAYYPPSRRMGRVFDLSVWQPTPDTPTTDLTKIRHLDAFILSNRNFIAPGQSLGSLTAMGSSGASFSAYYPDNISVFGFHDTFGDLHTDFTLDSANFEVSYQVTGWHSKASDDPLQTSGFQKALAAARKVNDEQTNKLPDSEVVAQVVQAYYQWSYDPTGASEPTRCLYDSQVSNIPWNTTGNNPVIPNTKSGFPKCYLAPPSEVDQSVRVGIGNSSSSALAALIKEQWSNFITEEDGELPEISPEIERNLEFLLDALQLGLLDEVGDNLTVAQLEQEVHSNGFGKFQTTYNWIIREKQKTDPNAKFVAPQVSLGDQHPELARKLETLNSCQQRLDALINTIVTCQQQIFMDWYKYITGLYDKTGTVPFQVPQLNTYLSEQVLDLWTKFEAAFGKQTGASPATGNIPVFYSTLDNYITQKTDGTYFTHSPESTLVGQVVEQANTLLGLLNTHNDEATNLNKFELQTQNAERHWKANEPVIVATGDTLAPADRNGLAKHLPCRLSEQLNHQVEVVPSEGAATQTLTGAQMQSALALTVPNVHSNNDPEAQDLQALLGDMTTLLGEKCLLDPLLVPSAVQLLHNISAADFLAVLQALLGKIQSDWDAGAVGKTETPAVLVHPSESKDGLTVTWSGQAPQGLAITYASDWKDPFLPIFLVWQASFVPFDKGADYAKDYLTGHFSLDDKHIDLVLGETPLKTIDGSFPLSGDIPLSSKIAEPLIDQINQYLKTHPNEELEKIAQYFADKPLLSQGLSSVGASFVMRDIGLQLQPFNPFYDQESTPTKLVSSFDNTKYINSLTHFIAWGSGTQTGQIPINEISQYNLLRAGFIQVEKIDLVDIFGRKRSLIDIERQGDAKKIITSWQMTLPDVPANKSYLAPRVAQPNRLLFRWLSADTDIVQVNSAPADSPICGWFVPNYLENSLMLFTGDGDALGSLGVFGAQTKVTWHSVAGNPPRSMQEDLAHANAHLRKVAEFILDKPRDFFRDLISSIENAHTYIMPSDQQAAQAQAVLMGQPLALVRASLRYELHGLPAFDTSSEELARILPTQHDKPYDWTQRKTDDLLQVDFPVRLGDLDHMEDGLVGYFLDSNEPYTVMYAPASPNANALAGIVQPAADTLALQLRANIDPPSTPYTSAQAQIDALRDCSVAPLQKMVTMLVDSRASVHATTGFLPAKDIAIPPDMTAAALSNIEVTFFTHPILRNQQGLRLPVPNESGFTWEWTTSVLQNGNEVPHNVVLPTSEVGDRASFSYSPQTAEDGWLKLKPAPSNQQQEE